MLNVVQLDPNDPSPKPGSRYCEDELHAMQRAIIALFAKWGVSDVDAAILLGGLAAKTFRRWKNGEYGRVNRDLADRMSTLLAIHKALRILFEDPKTGYEWMRLKNKAFDDHSALDILRQGGMEDLVRLRRYLDSVCGG